MNSNYNIAFVLPALPGGGLEVSMFRIASFLRSRGHAVSFFTTVDKGAWFDRINSAGFTGCHISGLTQIFPPVHARRVGRLLCAGGFNVIFTVFDRYSQASLGMLPDNVVVIPLLRNDHPEIYEIGLANSDAWNVAVANSPRNYEHACRLIPDKPIEMIPNGVNVPEQYELIADKFTAPPLPLKLIFVGRLIHESKGVLLLPEILKGCVERGLDCTLTIVGDGVDRTRLEHLIEAYNLNKRVRFTGMIEQNEVLALIRSSHIFLLPSFYEGLPNVLLEAQANGCVPIATLLPGVTDYLIKEGETGFLVAPKDVEAFIERISAMYRAPDTLGRIAENAFRFTKEEFSSEREGSRYLALIERVMAGWYSLSGLRCLCPTIDYSLFPRKYCKNTIKCAVKKHLPQCLLSFLRTIKALKKTIRLFIDEYVTNRLVAYIPSIKFRSFFYRTISHISMDRTVNIQMGCYLYPSAATFKIGTNSIVNRYCTLDRRGGLYIGACVNVSAEVAIYTAGHDPQSSDFHDYVKPVTIEDYVWLGTRSTIMPGVTIGKGALVLPGAVITKDVAPYKIVGGIPAKEVGERNSNLNYNPSWYPLFQ